MLDILGKEIWRGDRLLDPHGDVFTVRDVSPAIIHVQSRKSGKKYATRQMTFLKVSLELLTSKDMVTQPARKRYYYNKVVGPNRGH